MLSHAVTCCYDAECVGSACSLIDSVVLGYGRQLAELGTSYICTVDRECMVGMAQVGLWRPSWVLLTMRLLPGLEGRSHQQVLACSRREASLSAGLLLAEAMMLSPAAATDLHLTDLHSLLCNSPDDTDYDNAVLLQIRLRENRQRLRALFCRQLGCSRTATTL